VGPLLQATGESPSGTGPTSELVRFHEKAARWSYMGALPWGQFDPVTRRVRTDVGGE
jgi:hypothetical protein